MKTNKKQQAKIKQKQKIQLLLDKQQPETRTRLYNLLKKHHATPGFNHQSNFYEVQLQVNFNDPIEKQRFLQNYQAKEKRKTLSQLHNNNFKEVEREISQLKKHDILQTQVNQPQKQRNSYISQLESDHNNTESNNNNSQFSANNNTFNQNDISQYLGDNSNSQNNKTTEFNASNFQNQQKPNEIEISPITFDFDQLQNNIQKALNNSFDIISLGKSNSSNQKKMTHDNIVIIDTNQFEYLSHQKSKKEGQQVAQYKISPNQSPIRFRVSESSVNGDADEIRIPDTSAMSIKFDFKKYFVDSVITQENTSEFESENDPKSEKKKQYYAAFKNATNDNKSGVNQVNSATFFNNNRFFTKQNIKNNKHLPTHTNNPKNFYKQSLQQNYTSRNYVPSNFEEKKFKEFVQINKKKINEMFEDVKKNLTTFLICDSEKPFLDNSTEYQTKDQYHAQQFEKRFYKQYEKEILEEKSFKSSVELVKYFQALLKNAKRMYFDFIHHQNNIFVSKQSSQLKK